MMMNIKTLLILLVGTVLTGCSDFLDEKSDKKLAVPTTIQDLEALLGYTSDMNLSYCAIIGEVASDNLFLSDDTWLALNRDEDRAMYVWQFLPTLETYWAGSYNRVLNTNVVLENVDDIEEVTELKRNHVKGMALFYRALSFFDLLQIFSRSFDPETAANVPGIVLRLSGDIDEELYRNDQQACMFQIEKDLLAAEKLLEGWMPNYPTQPSIASVYALLSKYYLMIKDYDKSLHFASRCLEIKSDLLNYNTIPEGKYPFERYNTEVLFYAQSSGQTMVQESRARVAPELYEMYMASDKRKELFFTINADGYQMFTGDYGKGSSSQKFCGLTTAEVWLTSAECNIRLNKIEEAVEDMHHFIQHRYIATDHRLETMEKEEFLHFVLDERRKELIFRGVRWFDLKRLTSEESRVDRLVRKIEGNEITISIEQLKEFRFALPQSVIDATGIEQ